MKKEKEVDVKKLNKLIDDEVTDDDLDFNENTEPTEEDERIKGYLDVVMLANLFKEQSKALEYLVGEVDKIKTVLGTDEMSKGLNVYQPDFIIKEGDNVYFCDVKSGYKTNKNTKKINIEMKNTDKEDETGYSNLPLSILEKESAKSLTIETTLGDYLETNGITKTWLSEVTGINRVTILNIIKNPNTVTYLNACKIAKALGKSVFELFPCKI